MTKPNTADQQQQMARSLAISTSETDDTSRWLLRLLFKERVHRNIDGILRQHSRNLRRIVTVKGFYQATDDDIIDRIADAVDAGLITPDQWDSILQLDLITRAQLKYTGETIQHAV